jgi:hypothetical protein
MIAAPARSAGPINHNVQGGATMFPVTVFRHCLFCAFILLPSTRVFAMPVISEVVYDAVGTDNGYLFVELYGTPGFDLSGLSLRGINGSNGSTTGTFPLGGLIPADGIFVVADDSGDGTTPVPNADLILNFDFQNGPDSILLMQGATTLDALGYGLFGVGDVFAGEGTAAPGAAAGKSVARRYADIDTDDNGADFIVLDTPTPGIVTLSAVPLPASGWLLLSGLTVFGVRCRRASHL